MKEGAGKARSRGGSFGSTPPRGVRAIEESGSLTRKMREETEKDREGSKAAANYKKLMWGPTRNM